jgi:glycyl-tRNA synthetase
MVTMDQIVSLCRRRGFIFQGSDIYGGLSNSWDYGPVGVELKNNIKQLWWKTFVHGRDDVVGIDAALIMNPKVWEASGHVSSFSDPLVECKACHNRFRVDHLLSNEEFLLIQNDAEKQCELLMEKVQCPECGEKKWDVPKKFNLLFPVRLGSVEDSSSISYLRGETAQAMFVDFKIVQEVTAKALPFGVAQIGKAFRNEITPGNFIFRTREFEQMEIEYFFPEPQTDNDWQEQFEHWRVQIHEWFKLIGLSEEYIHDVDIPDGERAHYSKRTIDFEYNYPFGQKELYGLAYRTNFDLTNHERVSGRSMKYRDQQTGKEYIPHVIEPTWGVDRTVLAVLCDSYREEGEGDKKRIYLSLPPIIAPYKIAVFPLVKNKPDIVNKARSIYSELKKHFTVVWDERGNVGKRYYSQDEIGTPWCITVDYQTLEDKTVTIRDRDTTEQIRTPVEELVSYFSGKLV